MKKFDDARTPLEHMLRIRWSPRFSFDDSLQSPWNSIVAALRDEPGRERLKDRQTESVIPQDKAKIRLMTPPRRHPL